MPDSEWYQSLVVQLGAGGCFSLILTWIILKFFVKVKSSEIERSPIAHDQNGNGLTFQKYHETVILPKLDKLQEGHETLIGKVAALPSRGEINEDHKTLHERITNHEQKCVNFQLRRES